MSSSSSPWDTMGEIATVAQLTGFDAVKLIALIVQSANTARMHKKNCLKFADHLKLIGNLLQQLKIPELKKFPETSEPLEQLEDALRRSYVLVNSCKDKSYLYLLAMGWNIANQFKKAQGEIDRYLKLMPLITLVDNSRVRNIIVKYNLRVGGWGHQSCLWMDRDRLVLTQKWVVMKLSWQERLEHIERDQHEYSFDEEYRAVHDMIMNQDANSPAVLKKTLSRSYPQYSFHEALKEENEMLRKELHQSQAKLDVQKSEIIQHLIDVTAAAASMYQAKKASFMYESEIASKETEPGNGSPTNELLSVQSLQQNGWHYGLFDCCSTPYLCKHQFACSFETLWTAIKKPRKDPSPQFLGLKTCCCPCGTFSRIATVAQDRYVSYEEACCIGFPLFLILSCCFYTFFTRTKLRRMFNISGNRFDDFLSHCMCCCCALVQEWREVKIQGSLSSERTSTRPPSVQVMNSMKD